MRKIQNHNLVFKLSVFVYLFAISIYSFGADSATELSYADSLFKAKKYTESFEVYNTVLENGDYTPSMLLKMAFIREGLGDVSGALYYLNQYYNQTSNEKVLAKLEEIAKENQLTGYDFGDADFFINIYNQYRFQFLGGLFALSLFLFTLALYHKRKYNQRPIALGVCHLISLMLFFYLLNFGVSLDKGIIADQQTYLMTGPSGGANVLGIIEKGHRVEILGQEGIWVKIIWNNQAVYVRDNKIRRLS